MARIRTIKPEYWTNEQVMDCSLTARLLFIGLWNFCDDHGRHELSTRKIKAEIFPGDDITSEIIRGMLDELSDAGLIEAYSVEGKDYLRVTGWHHQKIDRPQKPRCPAPGEIRSENDRRKVATEGRKGEDRKVGKGEEGKDNSQAPLPSPARAEPQDPPPTTNEFDRVQSLCGAALGDQNLADAVIGPMVELFEEFGERRVLHALKSESRRKRAKPVKSWKLWAMILREALAESGAKPAAAAPPKPADPNDPEISLVDVHGRETGTFWRKSKIEKLVGDWAKNPRSWPQGWPPPTDPFCPIPRAVLVDLGVTIPERPEAAE